MQETVHEISERIGTQLSGWWKRQQVALTFLPNFCHPSSLSAHVFAGTKHWSLLGRMEKSAVTESMHFHFFDYCLFPVTLRPSSPVHHLSWLHSWPSSHSPNSHTGCPRASQMHQIQNWTLLFLTKVALLLCPCLHYHPKSQEWAYRLGLWLLLLLHLSQPISHQILQTTPLQTQFQSGLCAGSFVKHSKKNQKLKNTDWNVSLLEN